MPKTKIEWTDYSLNPVKGLCPVDCKDNQGKSYCYARKMYLNPYYKSMYQHQEIRWYPPAFDLLDTLKKPSRIFVGSTFELFLDSLPENWMDYNLRTAERYPQHTFIFLTKQPQNLIKWSPFPDNCYIGVTATDNDMAFMAVGCLRQIEAKVKYISFEPLLKPIIRWIGDAEYLFKYLDWVIIGAQTPYSPKTAPRIEWVQEIVEAADKAAIPVFLKENLKPVLLQDPENNIYNYPEWAGKQFAVTNDDRTPMRLLRQEYPNKLSEKQGVVYLQSQVQLGK